METRPTASYAILFSLTVMRMPNSQRCSTQPGSSSNSDDGSRAEAKWRKSRPCQPQWSNLHCSPSPFWLSCETRHCPDFTLPAMGSISCRLRKLLLIYCFWNMKWEHWTHFIEIDMHFHLAYKMLFLLLAAID